MKAILWVSVRLSHFWLYWTITSRLPPGMRGQRLLPGRCAVRVEALVETSYLAAFFTTPDASLRTMLASVRKPFCAISFTSPAQFLAASRVRRAVDWAFM